jgi:hypothetical protein
LNKHVFILALCAVMLAGCAKNPFSTRGTERPIGAAGTWETPHSPEAVVGNLLNAYNEHVISNYQLCFSDSFLFSSPEDSIDATTGGRPYLFIDWNKQTEIAVSTSIFITFTNSDTMKQYLLLYPASGHVDQINYTDAILYRDYSIQTVMTHAGIPDTTNYRGQATFHLIQETLSWWTIQWWEDLPAQSGALDWGDFKAEYRQ